MPACSMRWHVDERHDALVCSMHLLHQYCSQHSHVIRELFRVMYNLNFREAFPVQKHEHTTMYQSC